MMTSLVRAMRGVLILAFMGAGAAASAQQPAALAMLQPGLWQINVAGEQTRNICVADPLMLSQLRHGAAACSRIVVDNGKTASTLSYSCPGAGFGRTTVRVTTPRIATIDTQGIADNAPFAFTAEVHRVGDCAVSRSASLER
jgi:invasion protein IalB